MKFRVFSILTAVLMLSAVQASASQPGADRQTGQTQQVQQAQQVQQRARNCIPPVLLPPPLPQLEHRCTPACPAPNREKLHIVCILDRSGSMQRLTSDTIGGYNSFIDGQRADAPQAVVTTVLFDHEYQVLYENMPIKQVRALTKREYYARGTTALLDAVGSTILRLDGTFKKNGTCPRSEPAIFMIMTDGLENASREFNRADVKKLVSDAQEKYGWQFIFMGANIDSIAEAGSIGISKDSAMDYAPSAEGVQKAYDRAGAAVKSYRSQGKVGDDWKK
ncbi:MAG: vWA domain-containing protein [Pyramidobacter sp.]|jgi:hypothetical protein